MPVSSAEFLGAESKSSAPRGKHGLVELDAEPQPKSMPKIIAPLADDMAEIVPGIYEYTC